MVLPILIKVSLIYSSFLSIYSSNKIFIIENFIFSKFTKVTKLSTYSSLIFLFTTYCNPSLIPENISDRPLVPPVRIIIPNPEANFKTGLND